MEVMRLEFFHKSFIQTNIFFFFLDDIFYSDSEDEDEDYPEDEESEPDEGIEA